MAKYLGGISDVDVSWVSPSGLQVRFASTNTGFVHQLYYGRQLVDETSAPAVRELTAQVDPGRWQNHLTVLAVSGADVSVDHGEDLPPEPYNVAKTQFDLGAFPSDCSVVEFYRGDTAGAAVNTSDVWFEIPFEGARTGLYTVYSPPLPGVGTWNIEIAGRDDKLPTGNAGTAATTSVTVKAHPPDFDSPFSVSVSSGTGTITATVPEDS